MGSRRQPVLYYDQLRAAGLKPIVPRRLWRCRARRHEIQSREIHLALPPVSAHAGPSARNHRVPTRAGNGNDRQELEEVRRWKTWRGLATRFFRSSLARSSRTGRENQLHPDESGSQSIVPASRGLDVGISSKRPTAADLVGRAVPCTPKVRRPRKWSLTRPTIAQHR